jgi:DNA (cytosine-5)-methyltransferase 1
MNLVHGGGFHGGALGFEYAFQEAGFKTIWLFDNDPYCQEVAHRHYPDALQLGDVFDIHFPSYVDVFTAGFPCQPFSNAGLMKGADDPRYLLPQICRIISEVKPHVVLLENVPGFRTLDDGYHFKYLLRSLASMGYDAEWGRVRASHVGAPHERKRWCLVAYLNRQRELQPQGSECDFGRRLDDGYSSILAYPESTGLAQRRNGSRKNQILHRRASARFADARLDRRRSALQPRRQHGQNQSPMGRDVHGIPSQLVTHRWPADKGLFQHSYEPPRQIANAPWQNERNKALGNAVVPQNIYPLAVAIREWLETQNVRK